MLGPDDVIYRNRYVWNRYKNNLNKRKHHLGFKIAVLAFDDPFHIEEVKEYYEQFQALYGGEITD